MTMPEPQAQNTALRHDRSGAGARNDASRSDKQATFEAFYRHNYASTLRYVLTHTSNADAEALVAEAYLLAWTRFLTHNTLSRPWLFTVIKNKVGDHYRSTARRETSRAEPEPRPIDDPAPITDLKVDIGRVLQRLKPDHREALIMAYWFDLPTAEAAQLLGVSHVAYRVRLTRAKRAFLKDLESQREGPL